MTDTSKKKGELIPISREKALELQYELVTNWEPKSDVRMLFYGRGILGIASFASSLYYMVYYRKKVKLMNLAKPVTFFPGVVMPTLFAPIFHQILVTEPILLYPQCPVCIQIRSALIQSTAGVVYPVIVNSLSSFFFAYTLATYRLPELSKSNIGKYFALWKTFSKPLFAVLPLHILAQVAISFFVTEFEAREIFNLQDKLIQKHNSVKSS